MEQALVWAGFILCILTIFFSGGKVAKYGDIIARRTGLGGVWIGLVLLALVTSLPEVFTGISSVTLVKAPDLTIGNLFGANSFNLLNLALLDIACHNGLLLRATSPSHRLTGWLSMILVLLVALPILFSQLSAPGIGWIGWYSPVIVLLYLFFIRKVLRFEQSQPSFKATDQEAKLNYGEISLGRAYLYFAISAIFIIAAGMWLAVIGNEIASITGWGGSFVGSILLGFTTTLPEITVSLAAIKIGAYNMAVANMIGSNLFNMTVVFIDDLFYLQGPVLVGVSKSHLITALVVVLMTGIFILGLYLKPKRFFRLSWCNLSLIVLFLVGAYFNFSLA